MKRNRKNRPWPCYGHVRSIMTSSRSYIAFICLIIGVSLACQQEAQSVTPKRVIVKKDMASNTDRIVPDTLEVAPGDTVVFVDSLGKDPVTIFFPEAKLFGEKVDTTLTQNMNVFTVAVSDSAGPGQYEYAVYNQASGKFIMAMPIVIIYPNKK